MSQKSFALIGAGGYIAPRHMKAIKDTGNQLVAAVDKNDSVGVMDSYFPDADFFMEFEQFIRTLDVLNRGENKVDYVAIASPNYLHEAHIRATLNNGANAICEKPLVLTPKELDDLAEIESQTGRKVFSILQLRLHPEIVALKQQVAREVAANPEKVYDVELTYLTSRGSWYFTSWKGNETRSGGIATNIGVHFFDMLGFIFGELEHSEVHCKKADVNAGFLKFKHAKVRWFLSVKYDYIPDEIKAKGMRTYRSITVDRNEVEFSGGFTDLHTASYQHILDGEGFGLDDARGSIEIVSAIRDLPVSAGDQTNIHPILKLMPNP